MMSRGGILSYPREEREKKKLKDIKKEEEKAKLRI